MRIELNGAPLDLGLPPGTSIGAALGAADALCDRTGTIIVSVRVDGRDLDAEEIAARSEELPGESTLVSLESTTARDLRSKAFATAIEFASIARNAAESREGEASLRELAGLYGSVLETFSGFLKPEELSFLEYLGEAVKAPLAPTEIETRAASLIAVFGERKSELDSPGEEMLKAARLFDAQAPSLSEIAIKLQTGKEAEAMNSLLLFIELVGKVIRVQPELERAGLALEGIRIEGKSIPEYYADLNGMLRKMTEAFEARDSILIGDLAEYEIMPRMKSYFAALEGAIGAP